MGKIMKKKVDKERRVCYNCIHFEKSRIRPSKKHNKSLGCMWLELSTVRFGLCKALPDWVIIRSNTHYCHQFENRWPEKERGNQE